MKDNSLLNEFEILTNNVRQNLVTRGGKVILPSTELTDMPSSYEDGSILVSGSGGYSLETPAEVGVLVPTEITTDTALAVGHMYVTNNISLVTGTLPATAPFGSMIGICGKGAGGWKCTAATGDFIHHGDMVSLAGGSIRSIYYKDTVLMLCISANSDWSVIWTNGNIEVEVS
jgi:hypothetical protein